MMSKLIFKYLDTDKGKFNPNLTHNDLIKSKK